MNATSQYARRIDPDHLRSRALRYELRKMALAYFPAVSTTAEEHQAIKGPRSRRQIPSAEHGKAIERVASATL